MIFNKVAKKKKLSASEKERCFHKNNLIVISKNKKFDSSLTPDIKIKIGHRMYTLKL